MNTQYEIPLNSRKSVKAVDLKNSLGFDLWTKERPLANDNIISTFSLYEQYNIERDACEKYRIILNINPICTNVLFNMQTEIVQFEGSDSAMVITTNIAMDKDDVVREDTHTTDNSIQNASPINRLQAIRDTEYSHPKNGGFVYHCGVDIFNNHLLRKNGFVHVNKMSQQDTLSSMVYNTVRDYIRDGEGRILESIVSPLHGRTDKKKLHLYGLDNIKSLNDAYKNGIEEQDGWIGFKNPSCIDIENSDDNKTRINYLLNNRKACEFVDMYPDRSLYSFIPKYNKYRKRFEKNWDYCITYPYKKDYDLVNTIFSGDNQSIKCTCRVGTNTFSQSILFCKSLVRHNLLKNDTISIYYYGDNGSGETVFKKYNNIAKVVSVGTNDGEEKDFVFAIKTSDIYDILSDVTDGGLYFKRLSNGIECEYYFRKYKQIRKFDQNGDRSLELSSDVGKSAYATNIYGDRIAQVVFTDDVDVSGLYDHMGRPLSELYFTTIKANRGHELWYNVRQNCTDETIEYSHCFGKVTSGLYFGDDADSNTDYNIRYLHNISVDTALPFFEDTVIFSAMGDTVLNGVPKTIEDEIIIGDDVFYGDLVEFDQYNYVETELSPVLHRFNTAQREYVSSWKYADINYDRVDSDDFDVSSDGSSIGFNVVPTNLATVKVNGYNHVLLGNVKPEGYFYNPHSKIKIRENSQQTTRVNAISINYLSATGVYNLLEDNTGITFVAPVDYGFLKHGHIAIYDAGGVYNTIKMHPKTFWGEITSVCGTTVSVVYDGDIFNTVSQLVDINTVLDPTQEFRRYYIVYSEYDVPTYAVFVPKVSNFIWKSLVKPSQMTNDMDLYETTFANGCFYIEKEFPIFLRRQDKDGAFGLQYARNTNIKSPIEYFSINGGEFNIDQVIDFYNNEFNACY